MIIIIAEPKLSIVILTMNREKQVINALQSCIKCKLPEDTIFIIIDNASTDNTEEKVKAFIECNSEIDYIYKKMDYNTGSGMGRNIGFGLTKSEYVFFLDDDAVIDEQNAEDFFGYALDLMDRNPSIATLTTKVYDEALMNDRIVRYAKSNKPGQLNAIILIHDGSCFFRRSAFNKNIFPDIKYGFGAYYPSLTAIDNNYINAYIDTLNVIHQPLVDKWIKSSQIKVDVIIRGNAGLLTVKSLMYPTIFYPLLYVAFIARWFKYLRNEKGSLKRSYQLFLQQRSENTHLIKKIKTRTVFKIFLEFGFGPGV